MSHLSKPSRMPLPAAIPQPYHLPRPQQISYKTYTIFYHNLDYNFSLQTLHLLKPSTQTRQETIAVEDNSTAVDEETTTVLKEISTTQTRVEAIVVSFLGLPTKTLFMIHVIDVE